MVKPNIYHYDKDILLSTIDLKKYFKISKFDIKELIKSKMLKPLSIEGETIESLSSRTINKLNLELTRTINDKKVGEQLVKGELIKIVKAYSYFKTN